MSAAGHNSDGQLRAFIDRILRLKADQDSIADDIKEIYAEAKSSGYDKTAMGSVVSYLRKREKDAAKVDEQSAMFDLYLASYEGRVPRTHAPARVEVILPPHDPTTGELADIDVSMFDEPDATPAGAVVAEVSGATAGETARDSQSGDDAIGAVKGKARLPDAAGVEPPSPDMDSNPPSSISSPTETDKPGEVPPPSSSGAPFLAPQSPPDADGQPGKQGSDAGGAKMDGAATPPERGATDAKSEPAAAPFSEDDIPAFLKPPKPARAVREGCLDPDCCASSHLGLCHGCTKALQTSKPEMQSLSNRERERA